MGATIGILVGGLDGGAAGCVLGGIAGATVASAAIVGLFGAFIPAAAIGGIVAIGALGTIAGQLFVTAPVAIAAAVQYFTGSDAGPERGSKLQPESSICRHQIRGFHFHNICCKIAPVPLDRVSGPMMRKSK